MRLLFLAAVAWSAAGGLARAQDRVAVEWDAPEDACPPGEAFVEETESALGPREPGPVAPLHVDAHVVRRPDTRLVLEMVMHFASGDAARSLVASSCESLVHAGALVVALALAPERPATVAVEEPRPVPQRTDDEHPWPRPPPPPPPAEWALEFVVQALLDVGTMPTAAAGIAAGFGLRYRQLHLEGLFLSLPTADGEVRMGDAAIPLTHPNGYGHFWLLAGRLAASLDLLRTGSVTIGPTLAIEVGDLNGTGYTERGMPASQEDFLHVAAGAGARVAVEIGPLVVRLDVESLIPLHWREWELGTNERLMKPPYLGLRAGFTVGVHFP